MSTNVYFQVSTNGAMKMNPTSGPILAAGFPLGSSAGLVTAFEWLGQPYRITRVDMLGEMRPTPTSA